MPTTFWSRPRLRALAHTAVVLIAALASIATSQPRWHVAAPAVAKPSSGMGQLVTIEASAEPTVTVVNGPTGRRLRPEGTAGAWTGRADYFVTPSETLTSAEITGTCGGGGFCSKCEPPPGAFARIAAVVDVATWALNATSAPANFELSGPDAMPSFRVVVAATRRPLLTVTPMAPTKAGFFVSETPGNPLVDPKVDPEAPTQRYAFSVTWHGDGQRTLGPISGAWTPTATISGYCKEPGPCVTPTSERVTIVSVEGPPGTSPSSSPPPGAAPVGSAGP